MNSKKIMFVTPLRYCPCYLLERPGEPRKLDGVSSDPAEIITGN